jgi:glycosyltransferase involved in cell wall biosynthesis
LVGALLSYVTTCYFSVSDEAVKTVVAKENLEGKPCYVLHNCIDTEKLDSAQPSNIRSQFSLDPAVGPILVTCGRLVKLKNIDLVIRALPAIQHSYPFSHLLILGDGPERSRLERLVNRLKLEKSVTFGKFRSDIPDILKALASERAVFLQPSEHEGLSNALSEALYCGLPAVISDQVPPADRTDGAAVIVPCSANAISEAVMYVFSNDNRFLAMQLAAKRNVADLTPKNYVSILLKLYSSILICHQSLH